MEPERKIEKLLRAYAKKRRADAGDPLTLHPAARRLLQGEVARRKPLADDDASVSLWELFRQRWALLAGFAAICFFGAVLFLPALSKAKFKAQSVTAMNNLKQIGLAAQVTAADNYGKLPASLDVLTNALGSDQALTDPESGKPFIYAAAGENLNRLSSNAVLAYSSSDKKNRAVLFADGRVEVVNGTRLAELTNRGLSQLVARDDSARRQLAEAPAELKDAGNAAVAPPIFDKAKSEADRSNEKLSDTLATTGMMAANAPAPAVPALDGLAKVPSGTAKDFETQTSSVQFAAAQNFKNSSSLAQNSFKNTLAPAKAAVVLANFQVQQSGNAIRVVDADGSVYDGELQPENETKEQISTDTVQALAARAKTITTRDEPQLAQNSQTAQNYFFRVTGTNLTLKQNVVFAGNLLANSSAAENRQQSWKADVSGGIGGNKVQAQAALANQLPWANSRISGTAVVADTNSIEINAEPQLP